MILFIILAVLSNNQSKIPYHKQLTENERYEAKSYSSNLNNPALPVAEIQTKATKPRANNPIPSAIRDQTMR